jgi:DNA-binding transcriptional MocR family regulator
MQEPFPFKAPARLVDFMRQADRPGLTNLAAGVPGLDALPFEALREAVLEMLEKDGASAFAYHHPEGDHTLRELLSNRLLQRSVSVDSNGIVVTTGCTQALQGMLSVLVQPGDIVACEAPAYYGLLELIAEAGARVLPIPVHPGQGLDLDAAAPLLARWKPKCLIVCTSLSNPSGATIPESERPRLVELCRTHGVRLIEDDIYAELVDGGAPKPCRAFDDGSTVSLVTSFSKSVSPGLRVGYCIPGTPALHDAFAARKTQQDLHSSVVSEVILRRFILRGSLDPHLEWLRQRNRQRRAIALDAIGRSFPAGTSVANPCGGYMLWVSLPSQVDLAQVSQLALQQEVAFAASPVFYPRPPSGEPCMRINCAKADESALARGLEILGQLVTESL